MRMPPDLRGHGGSQRAWHLVDALREHGELHFVLMFRDQDQDCVATSLAPLEKRVASITRVNIPAWETAGHAKYGVIHPRLWDLARVRCIEAPRFARGELRRIAACLPLRDPDVIFAGRLCCAVMTQDLIDHGLLRGALRLVDFDDIMSKFRRRQVEATRLRLRGRTFLAADARLIARAEARIARGWHAVSVCTNEDVAALRAAHPTAQVVKVPNIALPRAPATAAAPRRAAGAFRVLFVGNLSFPPNVNGLRAFVAEAWPVLLRHVPEAMLDVVGFNPPPDLLDLAARHGFAVHGDAPSLDGFYRDCDVAIAPILFGSGTRIKILEAMSFGRAVVSTSVGAEGLGLEHGRDVLLADSMPAFAEALASLARDPALRDALGTRAREFQRVHFGPDAINRAIGGMFVAGRRRAAGTADTRAGAAESDVARLKTDSATGVAVGIAAQLGRFGLRVVTQIAIARLLIPDDFGLVAMTAPVIGFAQVFADPGLSAATVQRRAISQDQLSLLFWINIAIGVALAGICVGVAPLVAHFYREPRVGGIMAVSGLLLLVGACCNQHLALLTRRMRFRALAGLDAASALAGAAGGIGAALLGAGYWSILVNQGLATLATLVLAWTTSGWVPGRPRRDTGMTQALTFGANLTGFRLLKFVSRNSDNVLIGRFGGGAALGVYDRAFKLMLMPFEQITAPFSKIAVPLLSRTLDRPDIYRDAYRRLLEATLLLVYPGLIFMIAYSADLVDLALGPRWAAVAPIFAVLGVDAFVAPVGGSLGWLFVSQGRAREMRDCGLFASILFVGCFALGLWWAGPYGVAVGYAAAGVIEIAVVGRVATRGGPVDARCLRALLGPFALAVPVTFAVMMLARLAVPAGGARLTLAPVAAYASFTACLATLPRGRRLLREVVRQTVDLARRITG